MDAKVTWKTDNQFEGWSGSGLTLPVAGGPSAEGEEGFRPMELLLVGLGGCTGLDVISILEKKRQKVTHFEVQVHGDRADEHPKVFTHIVVEYIVGGENIDRAAVERAVELSSTKYCSARAMLGAVAQIENRITILDEVPQA
jgi:putative redox protein